MARKKNGAAALEDTQQLLADTNRQIEEQRRCRSDELSGAADESALDTFDAEIKRLEILAGRHNERIALLESAAAEAERERRVKEKEGLIKRIEKKAHDERRAAALEISEGIARADAGLRKLLAIARDTQAAWPWQSHELQPCMLTPSAILAAITHELYRVGARPRLFGGMDTKFDAGINFPGGKPTRLELAGLPERIPKLVDVMAEANELMSRVMRGKATAPPAPPATMPADEPSPGPSPAPSATGATAEAEPRERTTAELELDKLLQRQMKLSQDMSPAGETAYRAVVDEIARVSQQIESEKMGASHG
jgi:hypothetical protein